MCGAVPGVQEGTAVVSWCGTRWHPAAEVSLGCRGTVPAVCAVTSCCRGVQGHPCSQPGWSLWAGLVSCPCSPFLPCPGAPGAGIPSLQVFPWGAGFAQQAVPAGTLLCTHRVPVKQDLKEQGRLKLQVPAGLRGQGMKGALMSG